MRNNITKYLKKTVLAQVDRSIDFKKENFYRISKENFKEGIIDPNITLNLFEENKKEKAKYIAAKEIVEIAEAYFAANSSATYVTIRDLSDYLESDATNPATGENDLLNNGTNQKVCKSTSYSSSNQNGYISSNGYEFDGYWYGTDGHCKP